MTLLIYKVILFIWGAFFWGTLYLNPEKYVTDPINKLPLINLKETIIGKILILCLVPILFVYVFHPLILWIYLFNEWTGALYLYTR